MMTVMMVVVMVLTIMMIISSPFIFFKDKKDHPCQKKTRRLLQDTMKIGCPARLTIRDILYFPQYKVTLSFTLEKIARFRKMNKFNENNDFKRS